MAIRLTENFRAVFYAPFYATHALGFYACEGVEVDLLSSPAPATATSNLLDGTIDLSWGGPMRVMKARDQDPGSPLVCFCEIAARDPFFLVGRGDRPEFRLADLPRLRLATVSEVPTPWLCLQHDLRQIGSRSGSARTGDESDHGRQSRGPAQRRTRRGADVRALYVDGLQAGIGKILYAASERGPTVYTTFLATRDSIARNRTAFAAMVRAVRRMQSWLGDHGAEELADVVAPFYPDVAHDLLANVAAALSGCRPMGPASRSVAARDSRGCPKACGPAGSYPACTPTRTAWIRALY